MRPSKRLRASLTAVALTLPAAITACAAPAADRGQFIYQVSPPASNPHDLFRRVIKVPRPGASAPAG